MFENHLHEGEGGEEAQLIQGEKNNNCRTEPGGPP